MSKQNIRHIAVFFFSVVALAFGSSQTLFSVETAFGQANEVLSKEYDVLKSKLSNKVKNTQILVPVKLTSTTGKEVIEQRPIPLQSIRYPHAKTFLDAVMGQQKKDSTFLSTAEEIEVNKFGHLYGSFQRYYIMHNADLQNILNAIVKTIAQQNLDPDVLDAIASAVKEYRVPNAFAQEVALLKSPANVSLMQQFISLGLAGYYFWGLKGHINKLLQAIKFKGADTKGINWTQLGAMVLLAGAAAQTTYYGYQALQSSKVIPGAWGTVKRWFGGSTPAGQTQQLKQPMQTGEPRSRSSMLATEAAALAQKRKLEQTPEQMPRTMEERRAVQATQVTTNQPSASQPAQTVEQTSAVQLMTNTPSQGKQKPPVQPITKRRTFGSGGLQQKRVVIK